MLTFNLQDSHVAVETVLVFSDARVVSNVGRLNRFQQHHRVFRLCPKANTFIRVQGVPILEPTKRDRLTSGRYGARQNGFFAQAYVLGKRERSNFWNIYNKKELSLVPFRIRNNARRTARARPTYLYSTSSSWKSRIRSWRIQSESP